jgi:hypothetical protein
MFPNWSGWKTVKLLLVSLTGLAPVVTPPAYVALVTAVLSGITGVVVVLSGTAVGPQLARKP